MKNKGNMSVMTIVSFLCCMIFISCENRQAEHAAVPTRFPSETQEIPEPIQLVEGPERSSFSKKLEMILGKWKIIRMIGEGYIYGDVSVEDYVGGIVTIREDKIESDLPLGKMVFDDPQYKVKEQDQNDFWMYRHANMDAGFGFKSDRVKLVEVYDSNNESWDEFGDMFWIRDEEHLIFLGPVYFLAEKID